MEDRRRRHSWAKWTVAAVVGIAAAAAGLWAMWFNTPETEYYNAYICRYEIPQGIIPLSEEQRKNAADCYRVTTLHGRVIRLETVNSLGTVIDPVVTTPLSDYPRQDFTKFDAQGRPTEIELYNAQGVLVRRKVLSYNEQDNQIIIDYQQVGTDSNQTLVTKLVSGMKDESAVITPGHILRQVNTYNEEGLLVRCEYYKSAMGTATCDSRYVYGKEFEYTELGQVARMFHLDENGQGYDRYFDIDVQEFTYDEMGTLTSVRYCGDIGIWNFASYIPNGYSATAYVVDGENGNVLQSQRLDFYGVPCDDLRGVSRTDYTYDSQGFLVSQKQFDAQGQSVCDSNGCHEYTISYEPEHGRVCRITCMDIRGEPCANLYGYASVTVIRDMQGNELENWLYDAQGNLCRDMEQRICGAVYTYNGQGHQESCCYFGEQCQPVLSADGCHRKQMEYDEAGNVALEAWYDTAGNAVYRDGYAVRKTKYDAWGNVLSICFYDENGVPVLNEEGYHMTYCMYGETVNQVKQSFCGTEGKLTMTTGGYAVLERSINAWGEVSKLQYFDTNRDLIARGSIDNDLVFRILWYPNDEHGYIYTDVDGNPVLGSAGFHEVRNEQDEHGNTIRESYYDVDGNLVCEKWDGYAVAEREYVYFTDEFGTYARLKAFRVFDENGEPTFCGDGYHELRREYDEEGRLVWECEYDTQGNVLKEKVQNWDDW